MFTLTRRRPGRGPDRLPSFRPAAESLEDRSVPTTLVALEGITLQHLLAFDSANPGPHAAADTAKLVQWLSGPAAGHTHHGIHHAWAQRHYKES
jgi:hypothetical protein